MLFAPGDATPELVARARPGGHHLLSAVTIMLFFELFPAFMAIVALFAGIALFLMDREARHSEAASNTEGDG